jgi:hypothetical protein
MVLYNSQADQIWPDDTFKGLGHQMNIFLAAIEVNQYFLHMHRLSLTFHATLGKKIVQNFCMLL